MVITSKPRYVEATGGNSNIAFFFLVAFAFMVHTIQLLPIFNTIGKSISMCRHSNPSQLKTLTSSF